MTNKKLWGGRFEAGLDEDAKSLSYSLEVDKWLAPYDIRVNQAHAKALLDAKILTKDEYKTLTSCLVSLAKSFEEDPDYQLDDDEDIHSAIERIVTEQCGDLGKKMHAGKSRNDQVITDVRLMAKDGVESIISELIELVKTLTQVADDHIDTPFPGMTHYQPAQPVLFAHHMLAYCDKFIRDINRFDFALQTTDVCPLGSGALAGNNYQLNRQAVAAELGFSKISTNSMDAVSDRDFILEILSSASICMTHLSRFCEEIIIWNSPLLGFIHLSDAFTTGSSIMPQKKNPDIAELIRGKFGRVQGHFIAMQSTLKGLPLTYNRDLQEDKEPLFDTIDTVMLSLTCFRKMIADIKLDKNVINQALEKGYVTATEVADYLVQKNIPFREAHDITGKIVLKAIEENKQLHELDLAVLQDLCPTIDNDIFEALTIQSAIAAKNVVGGTAPNQVRQQLADIRKKLT
ncbi:argininosuccinate lyase [Candidatus Marinamargulisbacteria bacterium SCGC AG-414-C22]|nr:argininosuccinate lyase [Candidatus Marinamargulisbacteria bacterium SCGC AG-414-C22]